MDAHATKEEIPMTNIRQKPVTPKDLVEAGVGAKNTIYTAIKSGEIETFRLGGKIIIAPEWVSKNLGW